MVSKSKAVEVTEAADLKLRSHPRLFVTPERIANLKRPITLDWLKGVDAWLRETAESWLAMSPFADLDKSEFGHQALSQRRCLVV